MAGEEEDEVMEPAEKVGEESSDDDIEIVPKSVDNYWLEHGDETPISFATLPYFKTEEDATPPEKVVYVRGTQDNGMRLYMRAMTWKLELTKDLKPVFHLKTEKYWIQLLKPRKSYEETIRSIISVAYFLNYVLVNPGESEKAAWGYVKDLFPSWEVAPNRNDLSSHLPVVQHLAALDEQLAAASVLQFLDTGVSKKRLASTTEVSHPSARKGMYVSDDEDDAHGEPDQKRSKFEVDEMNVGEEMDGYGEEEEDDVGDLSETVCCICDNGGSVICCDGPCMRSFHLNKGAGGAEDSHCSTLGFSKAEAERMEKFFCPNCKFKKHQCYACGKLGCSDDEAGAAQEVFVCDAAMCGHFYHPDCVAELILKDKDSIEEAALAESIKEGKGFTCPMHKCVKCGKGEVKEQRDLQFGVCRRCPRVWHRKCLPFPIPDDASDEEEDDEPQRAWDDLLPNRILVYCKRHPIIPRLGTPARNHVKFPEGSLPSAKKVLVTSRPEQQEKKTKVIRVSKKDPDSLKAAGKKASRSVELDGVKKRKLVSPKPKLEHDASVARVSATSEGPILIKGRTIGKQDSSSQEDVQKLSKLPSLTKGRVEGVVKLEKSSVLKPPASRESALRQLQQQKAKAPAIKAIIIDEETKNMVNDLIERTKSLITMETVLQKQDIPACYRRISKNPDKKYSLFKIESITKGMRKAVETLETGGSIEDAKAKCSPDFIRFIELCRNDLRVYLSPFLHGARYTSYGRHFTKSEKLEEIVDRLHWYVDKGDMIVDFCCGANEFSLFMRKKLEETGKKCDYKNFDLIQTKNDFNFSKRDWFQVRQDELPDGNRLIMGLNPPFGVKGALANQFIDHALKFKPKLIVLIVPKETERLDRKHDGYDLVWEDTDLLSGQSFYLPGSVDVDEMPLNDWNVVAPPLFIWSRPDWTPRHKDIALGKGHISPSAGSRFVGPPWRPPSRPTSPSSLLNFDTGTNEDLSAPMEPMEGEEKKSKYSTLFQASKGEEERSSVPDSGPKMDRSSSAKSGLQDVGPNVDKSSSAKSGLQDVGSKLDRSSSAKSGLQDVGPKVNRSSSAKSDVQDVGPKLGRSSSGKSVMQDLGPKMDRSNSAKLKDQSRKSMEPSESRIRENSRSAQGTKVKEDRLNSSKMKTGSKASSDKVSTPKKQPEEGFSNPSEKPAQDSQSNQEVKATKKWELFKAVSSEGPSHVHATQKADKAKLDSQESPEKVRRSSEIRNDASRKERKSNDRGEDMRNARHSRGEDMRNARHDRGEDMRNVPARDSHQWKRATEKHRLNAEGDTSGKRSPNRYDKYESNRRKSPEKYERHSSGRRGEDRNASPDGSLANEQRRGSPGKSAHSSVVDLSTFFSSDDARRDYDDFARKVPGKDYQDSSYRGGSPNRNYMTEDSKRAWVDMEVYQRGPDTRLRTNEQLNVDYLSSGFPKSSYNDIPPYGLSSSEAQMNPLGRHYYDNGAPGVRRPDTYDVTMSRSYPDAALTRQSRPPDYYQSDLAREIVGLDRYTGQLRTEGSFRANATGGIGTGGIGPLPERSVLPPWPATTVPPPNLYNSAYASQLQHQNPLGIGDSTRISGQGFYENRLVQNANVRQSQYPSSQGRYPGQTNQQYGGWYED